MAVRDYPSEEDDDDAEQAEWELTPEGQEWRRGQAEVLRAVEQVEAADATKATGRALRERSLAAERPGEWAEWERVRHQPRHFIPLGPERPFDFEDFLIEVGRRPSPAHRIHRVDKTRGYEPGNMKWSARRTKDAARPPDQPYTTAEFAGLVNRSRYTVRSLCKDAIVRAERDVTAGRTGEWRIPPSELARWRRDGPFKLPRKPR